LLNLILVLGLAGWGIWMQLEPIRNSEAKPRICSVLDAQRDAWNAGDLDGFMAGYWNSDELTFTSGSKLVKGWVSTKERYVKTYQADGKEMGKLAFDDLEVEVLSADAALVRGKWELVLTKETVGGRFSLVLRKFADGWKITHDHTSK